VQAVPEQLPDYAWAGSDPRSVGVPDDGWAQGLAPLVRTPELTDLPDAPTSASTDLVSVEHPRIRVLGAYYHERWPFAIAGAYVRPEVSERLVLAVGSLTDVFGLAVWDAWRDSRLQAVLHERVYRDGDLPPGFVAPPDPDPRRCPPHASGGTVDLTLTWSGHPLALGTGFDGLRAASVVRGPGARRSAPGTRLAQVVGVGHVRCRFRGPSAGVVALGVRDAVLGRGDR